MYEREKYDIPYQRKNKSTHQRGQIQRCSTVDYVRVLVWMCISLIAGIHQVFPTKINVTQISYSHPQV